MRKDETPGASRIDANPGATPRAVAITQLCSWCGRVQRDGEWVALDADAAKPAVSHGVCPECFERVLRRERDRG